MASRHLEEHMSQEADNTKVLLKALKTCRCPCCQDHGAGRGWRSENVSWYLGPVCFVGRKPKEVQGEGGSSACLGNGEHQGKALGSWADLMRKSGACGQRGTLHFVCLLLLFGFFVLFLRQNLGSPVCPGTHHVDQAASARLKGCLHA